MPNQPKTPGHTIRVPDEEWVPARDKAAEEGKTMTDVIRRALRKYIAGAVIVAVALVVAGCGSGDIASAQATPTATVSELATARATMASQQATIATLTARLTAAEDTLASHGSRLDGAEGNIIVVAGAVGSLTQRVYALENH